MGEGGTFEVNCSFMYIKKDTRGQDRKTGHINLPFVTYNTNADKDSNKEWLKEGLEGLAHTRASRTLRSTIQNANKKWSSKITQKKKANRNNGQTKIKRIVKNKLLSKLPSKISKRKPKRKSQ